VTFPDSSSRDTRGSWRNGRVASPAAAPSTKTLALSETGGDIVLAGHKRSHKWNRYHNNRHYGWNGHRRHHGYSNYHRRHYGSGFSFGLSPYPYYGGYGGYGYGYGPSFGIYIR